MRGSTRAVERAKPLAHDALATELAGLAEYNRAVLFEMLIEHCSGLSRASKMQSLICRLGALASAVHCAFDLLELDGKDLRREPIEERIVWDARDYLWEQNFAALLKFKRRKGHCPVFQCHERTT
jgi:hypothetical protein